MGKYLKKFENHSQYESYIATDYAKPNVSYCVQQNEVHYNPIIPMNLITYTATAILPQGNYGSSGLYYDGFNTTITSHTFDNGIGTITFDSDVTTFKECCFYRTGELTGLNIPSNITSIHSLSLQGCTNLTNIVVSPKNNVYDSRNNCNAIIQTSTNTLLCGCKASVIPNTVTNIGERSFAYCYSLTDITIPNTVTNIGQNAFYMCTDLEEVTIGSGVTTIGQAAFMECSKLTSVTILATTPPTLGTWNVFSNNASGRKIYVPAESVNAYKAASGWSTYAADIEPIP